MELPKKKYKIIYADPPWSYDKKVGQGIADDIYETMPTYKIIQLPIEKLAEDNSVIFMWATFPMLKDSLEVMSSWGFEYKTCGFNWIKLNSDNGKPFFGIGHYTASNSEICLIGIRGKGLERKDKTISQVIISKKDKHSKKPQEIYKKIERLYGEVSRIELFARHKREGWDAWGNEVPKEEQKILK